MRIDFGYEYIVSLFGELKGLEKLTVVPLIDTLSIDFANELQRNKTAYGITFFREMKNHSGDSSYEVVVNGTITDVGFDQEDIDVEGDETWRMRNSICFSGNEADYFLMKLMGYAKTFDFDRLRTKSRENLLQKGNISHLSLETRRFYKL